MSYHQRGGKSQCRNSTNTNVYVLVVIVPHFTDNCKKRTGNRHGPHSPPPAPHICMHYLMYVHIHVVMCPLLWPYDTAAVQQSIKWGLTEGDTAATQPKGQPIGKLRPPETKRDRTEVSLLEYSSIRYISWFSSNT